MEFVQKLKRIVPIALLLVIPSISFAQMHYTCVNYSRIINEEGAKSPVEIFTPAFECSISVTYINQNSGEKKEQKLGCRASEGDTSCIIKLSGQLDESSWKPYELSSNVTIPDIRTQDLKQCETKNLSNLIWESRENRTLTSYYGKFGGSIWREYVSEITNSYLAKYNMSWEGLCESYGEDYCPGSSSFNSKSNNFADCTKLPECSNELPLKLLEEIRAAHLAGNKTATNQLLGELGSAHYCEDNYSDIKKYLNQIFQSQIE